MNKIINYRLKIISDKFEIMKKKLNLSDLIIGNVIILYKKTIETNISRGRPINAMAAAIIYVACRESNTDHTLNEITEITKLRRNSIAKCYHVIVINFNLKMPVSNIQLSISKISKNMAIHEEIIKNAR